jgi:hypothetical protein
MLDYAKLPATRRFAVEVSGWDKSERFFVENCDLLWSEENGKHVVLAQKLRANAILFVRLLQSVPPERSHPVVYEAEFVGKGENGGSRFRLKTVTPKMIELQQSAN